MKIDFIEVFYFLFSSIITGFILFSTASEREILCLILTIVIVNFMRYSKFIDETK